MQSIHIQYRLREYFSFLEFLSKEELSQNVTNHWAFKIVAYPFWSLIFIVKKFTEGHCLIHFNHEGFIRKSKSGISGKAWSELKAVKSNQECYVLVGQKKGMVPIPKRCLSLEQQELFEKWTGLNQNL